jgi:hypothetical protein
MRFDGLDINEELQQKLTEQFNAQLEEQLASQTSGLKAKVDELLSEKKRVQQEREEARLQAKLEAEEKAKAENDYKQLFESQKGEADILRKKIEEMNANITKQKISTEAAKIAANLTKDTQRASLLQKEISQRLTLVDGELRITDESGQLTVSSLDDLTNSIRTNYPFLVDGTQANGGGAARSEGRAEDRAKEVSRAEFEGMSHSQRAEFFQSGGSIFDD